MTYSIHLQHPGAKQKALRLVTDAPDDAVVTIKLGQRSVDQNGKMWEMLTDISLARPEGRIHSPDVWKCIFMNALGHEVRFVPGLDGEIFPVGFRTSKLNKGQMSALIEMLYWYGAKHGIVWSDEKNKQPEIWTPTISRKAYMGRVASLPCCACGRHGPSTVHHVICGRYSTQKADDYDTIPLCPQCHQWGPLAIHNGKEAWIERCGPDFEYIPRTREAVRKLIADEELGNATIYA